MKPRVRFAPSPTGYLHIGGARTALFNWLYARHHGGTFVLRVEDTDQQRSTPESVKAIFDALTWLGIDWDEGPGKGGPYPPYTQLEKLSRYHQVAEQLIAEGKAYRDYSTKEDTARARREFAASKGLVLPEVAVEEPEDGDEARAPSAAAAEEAKKALAILRKAGFKYRSPWRDKSEKLDRPAVIRFKMPELGGTFGFADLVLGDIEKPYEDVDDFVLLRADGIPLYNFGCVVDDHDMHITLVGRGQEHINSTFPQLMLYRALGWTPPDFAHIPLILGADREKLSKRRHPEADVMRHKENGILPHALINFIVRLGWSHGNDEYFTRQQLIELFDFKDVGRTNGVWNPQKLTATNEHWLKNGALTEVAAALLPFLHAAGVPEAVVDPKLEKVVAAFRTRAKTLVEMAASAKPYYTHGVTIDGGAAAKHLGPEGKAVLKRARELLGGIEPWTAASLDPVVKTVAEAAAVKMGQVAQPIRVAVTGNTVSPGIGETLELLGRAEALFRIDAALA